MQPLHTEDALDFSDDADHDEDALLFDIDADLDFDDADLPDTVTLERELGHCWRSGRYREDA